MDPLTREQFEDIVREALESLPKEFLSRLENVVVMVEDEPSREQLDSNGLGGSDTLLGLYEGVPLTERHGYNMALPDRITIFQKPLEADCDDKDELISAVQSTVIHEVAHFFGISDDALDAMGLG